MFLIFSVYACKDMSDKKESKIWRTKKLAQENAKHNELLKIEEKQGWKLLFDGKTLNGWHLYNYPDSTSVWKVDDGILYCNAKDETRKHGDLITDKAYENYELTLDWKISGRGNSGIFINVQEKPELTAAWQSGPEYQLLDPDHMDSDVATKQSGCLYGFSPQTNKATTKQGGQWNHTRIKQLNGKIEFYLNGVLTSTEDFTSPAWKDKVASSGFKKHPEFGKSTAGKIALQNWYFDVWFRNIKIREL